MSCVQTQEVLQIRHCSWQLGSTPSADRTPSAFPCAHALAINGPPLCANSHQMECPPCVEAHVSHVSSVCRFSSSGVLCAPLCGAMCDPNVLCVQIIVEAHVSITLVMQGNWPPSFIMLKSRSAKCSFARLDVGCQHAEEQRLYLLLGVAVKALVLVMVAQSRQGLAEAYPGSAQEAENLQEDCISICRELAESLKKL
jgi:hypothetical protein